MASTQRIIQFPTQQTPFSYPLTDPHVAAARHRLLNTMKSAVQAISAEIAQLENTGDLSDSAIDRSIEALLYASIDFREEQEMAPLRAACDHEDVALKELTQHGRIPAKRGSGRFDGGLRGEGVAWNQ